MLLSTFKYKPLKTFSLIKKLHYSNFNFNNLSSKYTYIFSFPNKTCFRNFQTSNKRFHGEYEWKDPKSEDEIVKITFVLKDGEKKQIQGKIGDNVLYLGHRHNIPLEGACEASLACSTCHVYVKSEYLKYIQEPNEKEDDMLDMAFGLKENSRLGCQITLCKDMDGMILELPQATRNFYVDGHVPAPH